MSKKTIPNAPSLAVETALQVIGGKWKVLIVWHLKDSVQRYSAIKRLIPYITEKVLIRQLRELVADGIILRHNHETRPPRVEYYLSEHGKSLMPVLELLCQWGQFHLEEEVKVTNQERSDLG